MTRLKVGLTYSEYSGKKFCIWTWATHIQCTSRRRTWYDADCTSKAHEYNCYTHHYDVSINIDKDEEEGYNTSVYLIVKIPILTITLKIQF